MSETYKPQLKEVSLKISDIECKTFKFADSRSIGLIKFKGKYRSGEDEAQDALWMRWHIDKFCDIEHQYIKGLIIDLRELDYSSGDELATIIEFESDELFRMAYAGSPPKITYILLPSIEENATKYELFSRIFQKHLHTDLNQALAELNQRLAISQKETILEKIEQNYGNTISAAAFEWNVPETPYKGGLLVYKGKYRYGSSGKPDAFAIDWLAELYTRLYGDEVKGLVVDYRQLDYRWGNNFDPWIDFFEGEVRYVIPTEDKLNKAYKWAFIGGDELTTSIDTAFEEVKNAIQQKYSPES